MSTRGEPGAARPYAGRSVAVCVGGGIAAYKAVELVRQLDKAGAAIQVIMTKSAARFVGPVTFQALSRRPVFTDLWSLAEESEIGHIAAADGAELVIVAPATANLIARMSAGRAADAVTAVLLATRAPVLIAPSMNVNMWNHPATRSNLERVRARPGVFTVGPGVGFLACQWEGAGRLAEPHDIVEAGAHILSAKDLTGRRLVVTAGPTREPIDPVRFLGNRSSGKMGFAIARAAARRGAQVDLIAGPVSLFAPPGVTRTDVQTANEMQSAVELAAAGADAVIMVAAVADFRPGSVASEKLKKEALGVEVRLPLERNPDILAELGRDRRGRGASRPLLVGFAAETENVVANARKKLESKAVDMIVANDVSRVDIGFSADDNHVTLVEPSGDVQLAMASKDEVAHSICDRLVELFLRSSDPHAKVAK